MGRVNITSNGTKKPSIELLNAKIAKNFRFLQIFIIFVVAQKQQFSTLTIMATNDNKKPEIKIELTPEIAAGHYANLAVVAHSPNEFFIDFINVAPNMPQARVQSRIIMTPENMKNLVLALRDNLQKYEQTFGQIKPKTPSNKSGNDIPNPFQA